MRRTREILFEGKKFNNLREIADYYDVRYSRFYQRYCVLGWDLYESLELVERNNLDRGIVAYGGRSFESLHKLAVVYGIDYRKLRRIHLVKGYSLENVMEICLKEDYYEGRETTEV